MLTYINNYIVDVVQAQTTDKNAEHVKILNSFHSFETHFCSSTKIFIITMR